MEKVPQLDRADGDIPSEEEQWNERDRWCVRWSWSRQSLGAILLDGAEAAVDRRMAVTWQKRATSGSTGMGRWMTSPCLEWLAMRPP